MKPDDPQQMEVLGPADSWWAQMAQQEIEEYEQWLDEMEADDE